MINVKFYFTCGCGFYTKSQDKAIEHCQQKGHTLTIAGTVRKEENKEGSHG